MPVSRDLPHLSAPTRPMPGRHTPSRPGLSLPARLRLRSSIPALLSGLARGLPGLPLVLLALGGMTGAALGQAANPVATWTGALSQDWDTAGNWSASGGALAPPGEEGQVRIDRVGTAGNDAVLSTEHPQRRVLFLSVGANGPGRLDVRGEDVRLIVGQLVTLGGGGTGNGLLVITDGARIGVAAGGPFGVNGTTVGLDGIGALEITAGGRLTTSDLRIGQTFTGSGSVEVRGDDSSVIAEWITVGHNAPGRLTVSDGAFVDADELRLGHFSLGKGEMLVTQSSLRVFGPMVVGARGEGRLALEGGAQAEARALIIGAEAQGALYTGLGTLEIRDGARLAVGTTQQLAEENVVRVGEVAQGILVLGEGGTLSITNENGLGILELGNGGGTIISPPGSDEPRRGPYGELVLGSRDALTGAGLIEAARVTIGAAGRLSIGHSDTDYSFAPELRGSGAIAHSAGTTRLTAESSFDGSIALTGGTLLLDGGLGAAGVVVTGGGRLGGAGTTEALADLSAGGTLLGVQGATLTLASLELGAGSVFSAALAAAGGAAPLVDVTGTARLGGTLDIEALPEFGNGLYTLIRYGALAGSGTLALGETPEGFSYEIDVGSPAARAVTLAVSGRAAGSNLYWDGSEITPGGVPFGRGGAGIWGAGTSNWTSRDGTENSDWAGGYAVFAGTGGDIRVVGLQEASGMQFAADQYRLLPGAGGALALTGTAPVIRTDRGTTSSIDLDLSVAGNLSIRDAGNTLFSDADFDIAGRLDVVSEGRFYVSSGAKVSVGSHFGAAGARVNIAGTGTRLDAVGELLFDQGSRIYVGDTAVLTGTTYMSLGGGTQMIVSGDGTRLEVENSITAVIGRDAFEAASTLEAREGAAISITDLSVGAGATAHPGGFSRNLGELRIADAGSILTSNFLVIGNAGGRGRLEVEDGGVIETASLIVGTGSAGQQGSEVTLFGEGAVLVSGEGALIDVSGEMTLGSIGSGVAEIRDGGAISARRLELGANGGAGALTIGSHAEEAGSDLFSEEVRLSSGWIRVNPTGMLDARSITVGAGTRLLGTGVIRGDITVQGRLAPDPVFAHAEHRMRVTGDVSFAAGSVYEVAALANGQSAGLVISGAASLGGTVEVETPDPAQSYLEGQRYTILTASEGVSGVFGGATMLSDSAFLAPVLSYEAGSVILTLALEREFETEALTRNQREASLALFGLDQTAGSDALAMFNAVASLDGARARLAFDLASGEIHASGRHLVDAGPGLFGQLLRWQGLAGVGSGAAVSAPVSRAAGVLSTKGITSGRGAWAAPVAGSGALDGSANAAALDWRHSGLAAGYEIDLGDAAVAGIALGWLTGSARADDRLSRIDSRGYHLGLYGARTVGPWTFAGNLGWSRTSLETRREIAFAGRTARAEYDVDTLSLGGEISYAFTLSPATRVAPLVTLDAGWSSHDGFTETGAGALNLTAAPDSWRKFDAGVGVAVSHRVATGRGALSLEGRAVWERAFGDLAPRQQMALAGGTGIGTGGFSVEGAGQDRDRLRLGAGMALELGGNVTIRARYEGLFSDGQRLHGGSVGVQMRF